MNNNIRKAQEQTMENIKSSKNEGWDVDDN